MAKPKGAQWLDRNLVSSHVYYALCVSEAQYQYEMRKLGVTPSSARVWISPTANATMHELQEPQTNRTCCVVCIDPTVRGRSGVQIAALLVHEAMHIWRCIREGIGEDSPSSEFEAYSMQAIAQSLMQSYADQTRGAKKPRAKAAA